MEAMNWTGIAALVIALGVSGVLVYLFKVGKIQTGDVSNIAGLIDKFGDVLEGVGKSDNVVSLFADYAAKAVRVVEQLVKNGELKKDNEARKNEAKAIVEQLAMADGFEEDAVYEHEMMIGNLIEAAVNEMQSAGVKIEFGAEEIGVSPSEVE